MPYKSVGFLINQSTPSIDINTFVKRQTKDSKYSYFDGSWEELINLVKDNYKNKKESYNRKGVIYVPVSPERFFSSIIDVTQKTKLKANFYSRREGESPYVQVEAIGSKVPAKYVTIVLYSHELLIQNNENSTNSDFEIISINAGLTDTLNEPTPPMAMARNQLNLPGGTKASYTAKDFAESIIYWSNKVHISNEII